jgi:hypothetical protein
MMTECNQSVFEFPGINRREVVASFTGGAISSDGGGLLLRQTEQVTGVIRGFAACFTDHRDPELIEHTVADLVGQRVYGLALGYEDLNDHDRLRYDPLLATLVGKADPTGQDRSRTRDRGKALADSYPSPSLFRRVCENLRNSPPGTAETVCADVTQNPGRPSSSPP